MKNYLTYPFAVMRITQNYNGATSHYGHSHGKPADWPTDEGGSDGGRDPIYSPCDLKIIRIYGVGTSGVNTLFCESVEEVVFANGKTDYAGFQITHPNDSDLRRLKVGQIVKKGQVLCYEGTDGASGNHIHLSVGRGKLTGNGWTKNSKGKYVLTTTGGALKPEDAFFVDPKVTTVMNAAGLKFKTVPAQKPTPGKYRVTVNVLNVRAGTSTKLPVKTILGKGAVVEITKVKTGLDGEFWGKADGKGWVRMEYLEAVK
ncbi:MAG: hypothetical protein IKN72_03615 [Clostridia bacterium]|nr:hypothetical protein [Clostridia bacterium]